MDLDQLNEHLKNIMEERNSTGIVDFLGYSPIEMNELLYAFGKIKNPVNVRQLKEEDYYKIPIFQQVNYLMQLIHEAGEIKLTQKGFLPTKYVKDIYSKGYIKDYMVENGHSKVNREEDLLGVHLAHILLKISGLSKKRNGKLSLTKLGLQVLQQKQELFTIIWDTFMHKFNWAYFDGYNSDSIGRFGYRFSLILLSKYGDTFRPLNFYANKYLTAFPSLMQEGMNNYATLEEYCMNCYNIRTFKRGLDLFGLIAFNEYPALYKKDNQVKKTPLFNSLIKIHPPKTGWMQSQS